MKVTEHIEGAEKPFISFEILPPLKGKDIKSLYRVLDPLMEFKPPFINVTYHRSEYIYKKNEDDTFDKVIVRKRPGTVGICSAIRYRYKTDAVPHLICGGFTKDATEDALIDLHYLGIHNVLALRGDAIPSEKAFYPEKGGNKNALELVEQIGNMNKGIYLAEDLKGAVSSDFCIGVAGYPEKHIEAPNITSDLKFLKRKINAGAEYVMTQMFFDADKYKSFVKSCREIGINVPIIPGIKPITRKKQIVGIPRIFNVDIPEELRVAVENCKNDEEVTLAGREWCIAQCKKLIEYGAPSLHFYTMGKIGNMVEIARGVF